MSNDPADGSPVDALRRFGEICQETIGEQDDGAGLWTRVRDRLDQLSESDRDEIRTALRQILDFQSPTSRTSH